MLSAFIELLRAHGRKDRRIPKYMQTILMISELHVGSLGQVFERLIMLSEINSF
jgi:hypothetical protein